MIRRHVLMIALLCALAGIGFAIYTALPGAKTSLVGGPFALTAQDGRRVSATDFAGMPMLVFFGYTHCPDVCPTTLSDLSLVLAQLPKDAKLAALFITVDPERDTPAVLKEYLSSFDPRILALSGTRAEIEPVYRSYRVYAKKVPGKGEDYGMDHTALVYLMDKAGNFAGSLNLAQPVDAALRDLKAALL